jgi:hypothetical protein
MKNSEIWLKISCWVGAFIDAAAAIMLMFPKVNQFITGINDIPNSAGYRNDNATATALMWGWTALLIWASRKPYERRGVVALTILPVVVWLICVRLGDIFLYGALLDRSLPLLIMQFSLVGLFSFSLWINSRKQIH